MRRNWDRPREKFVIHKPKRETSEESHPVDTLLFRIGRSKFLLLKPLSLWYLVTVVSCLTQRPPWGPRRHLGCFSRAGGGRPTSAPQSGGGFCRRATLWLPSSASFLLGLLPPGVDKQISGSWGILLGLLGGVGAPFPWRQ